MPGQTRRHSRSRPPRRRHFNGGPDNCPAKLCSAMVASATANALQWRAGQLPGQTAAAVSLQLGKVLLQWRAGQLPGQTRHGVVHAGAALGTSMEGRTIARPNPASAGVEECLLAALQWRAGQLPGQTRQPPHRPHPQRPDFNGGPDNCPAKPAMAVHRATEQIITSMEGRTIARPNGSRRRARPRAPDTSMEGRTIARPNDRRQACEAREAGTSMEGRTIARPNTGIGSVEAPSMAVLQWRAGQLPGQTGRGSARRGDGDPTSMEGRTIARPNARRR